MKQRFRLEVLLMVLISFINSFDVSNAYATEDKFFGELVEIGGGRKIYLECRGTRSPTVVLISGTRRAHDDWTDLIDPKNPADGPKPGESAVFQQVSKFARVCACSHNWWSTQSAKLLKRYVVEDGSSPDSQSLSGSASPSVDGSD